MKRKGQLGLGTAKLFVLAVLALVIISVVVLIVFGSLRDLESKSARLGTFGTLTNITTDTSVNFSVGSYPVGLRGQIACELSIDSVINSTNILVPSVNYTVTDCLIKSAYDIEAGFNNSLWNISGTYGYNLRTGSQGIINNTSSALTSFFEDAGTWFTLIGIIIIIMIISVVIVVVNKFGGGNEFSRASQTQF